jgi:hypothetical protein
MARLSSILFLGLLLLSSLPVWADMRLEPSRVDFGQVPIATVREAEIFVYNDDDDRIIIEEIGPRDAQDGTFFVVHDECTGQRLRGRESCRFILGFYPLEEKSYSGRIDVTYNDGGRRSSRESVRVSGEGVRLGEPPGSDPPDSDPPDSDPPGSDPPGSDPPGSDPPGSDPPGSDPPGSDPPGSDPPGSDPPGSDPPGSDPPGSEPPGSEPPAGLSLFIDSEEVVFGSVYLGTRNDGSLILINTGGVPIVIGEIIPDSAFGPPFSLRSDGCSQRTLNPGGRCGLRIEFFPWESGIYRGILDIPYGEDGRTPLVERVHATGTGYIEPGNIPPDTPVLIHPLPDQDNLRTSVTFRWSRCEDPDGDPVGYWIFYSQSPDFEGTIPARLEPGRTRLAGAGLAALAFLAAVALPGSRRRRYIVTLLLVLSLIAACSDDIEDNATVPAFRLEAKTTYYWKVVADDGRGGLSHSEVRSFTTR